jgi:hypothetical protein
MKQNIHLKTFTTLILLFLAIPMLFPQVRGNGNVEKQERSIGDFSGIVVRSGIDLLVTQGEQQKVVIETDENLQPYIITEVESGILYIYVQKNTRISRSSAMDAHVTVDQLNKLNYSGGGDLILEITCEKIKVSSAGGGDVSASAGSNVSQAGFSLLGGGDLSLEISAGDLVISMGGGGDAELRGSAGKMACDIKSGGNLNAPDFRVKAAKIELSGGGDARIHVDEELLLNASGGSQIYISGDPHIDANLSGGSELHRE